MCLSLITAGAVPAFAQEETPALVEASDEQLELNEQGVDAISEGEYEQAIRLFEKSLETGELNITHANLARAHQRADNCKKADYHLDRALESPPVKSPPPRRVRDAIASYRAELRQECPGYLNIECNPEQIELYIDGVGPQRCDDNETRELMPGNYDLRGEYRGQVTETTVSIEALEVSSVRLGLSDVQSAEPQAPTPPRQSGHQTSQPDSGVDEISPPPQPESALTSSTRSWLWLTGSALTLAGGVALDTIPEWSRNGELNAVNFIPVALYGVSIGMAWRGISDLIR